MTLVDLSEEMLEVSRRLNPDCDHHRGDMRAVRLGRAFDAVFLHDAVDYMTTEADLLRAIETAFAHCRPGGIAVFLPDGIAETFQATSEHGGSDDPAGRGARYLAWTWDPEPDDTWVQTDYAFLLRAAGGSVQVVHETHRTGLFSRDVWIRLLSDAGFAPSAVTEKTTEERTPRDVFVGRRAST
jgi:trans-aconitate methyltransferase